MSEAGVKLGSFNVALGDNGLYALVQETKVPGSPVYGELGGSLMPQENLVDTAIREAREETGYDEQTGRGGLEFEVIDFIGWYQQMMSRSGNTLIRAVYLSHITGGEFTPTPKHPTLLMVDIEEVMDMGGFDQLRSNIDLQSIIDHGTSVYKTRDRGTPIVVPSQNIRQDENPKLIRRDGFEDFRPRPYPLLSPAEESLSGTGPLSRREWRRGFPI